MASDASKSSGYEITLRPQTSWLSIELRSIWHYRDLLSLLVWRDFATRYKQTILGPLWFILQPVLMTVVMTVTFSKIAGLSTDGLPPFLFYLCGQLGWNYFANTFSTNSTSLTSNSGLFSKVYFPRLVVPLSVLISNLLQVFVQGGTFVVFYLYYRYFAHVAGFGVSSAIVWLPLVVLYTALLSLGTGLLFSALSAKYRDLTQLGPLIVQIWMYATPIIYPLSKFPEKYRWIAACNPMSPVIESWRLMLLGTGTVTLNYILVSVGITFVLLIAGLLAFGKVEKTFVDTV